MYEEVLSKRVLPAIKTYLLKTYYMMLWKFEDTMRMTEIARRIGTTPAALIKYRGKLVTDYLSPETWNQIEKDVKQIVTYIYSPNFDHSEFNRIMLTYWVKWNSKGIMCREIIKERSKYVGIVDGEALCRKIIKTYGEILVNSALVEVQEAYNIFVKIPNIHEYIPEVSTNIVRLVEVGREINSYPVIGFPGRITCVKNRVIVHSPPRIGGSRHMGRVLRKLYSLDSTTKGMTGIGYDEKIISEFLRNGYNVERFRVSSDDELIRKIREVVDVVVDEGGIGREGFIYISGYNSLDAVRKLEEVLRKIYS